MWVKSGSYVDHIRIVLCVIGSNGSTGATHFQSWCVCVYVCACTYVRVLNVYVCVSACVYVCMCANTQPSVIIAKYDMAGKLTTSFVKVCSFR